MRTRGVAVAPRAVAAFLAVLGLSSAAAHALSITGRTPAPNTVDAAADSPILIVFGANINPATVNSASVVVNGSISGLVPGLLSVSLATITFTPSAGYACGETVTITVTTAIEDISSGTLAAPQSSQFVVAPVGGSGELHPFSQGAMGSGSKQAALGDLDGDGDLDAWLTNANTGKCHVWFNDGAGDLTDSGQSIPLFTTARDAALGDLDADGDLDAWIAASSANEVWFNDGSGIFADSGQTLGGTITYLVALGDLDGDGDLDAFAVDSSEGKIWLNDGSGVFTDSGQSLAVLSPKDIAIGDMDGDGDLDAVIAGGTSTKVWLNELNDGSGVFADSGQDLSYSNGIALGDLDGDGDLDALLTIAYTSTNWVLLNDGSGTLTDSGQSPVGTASGVSLGDLDGDGDLDALTENSQGPSAVWLNDGAGAFTATPQVLPPYPYSQASAIGDLDGDGDLDALVCSYTGDAVLMNTLLPPFDIVDATPIANALDVPVRAPVVITFSVDIYPPSVDSSTVVVTGSLSGPVDGTYNVLGPTVIFTPTDGYRSGETVTVSVVPGITEKTNGAATLTGSFTWQFVVAAADGGGEFVDRGERFTDASSLGVALGDLDGDGDLDAVMPTSASEAVWLNDGLGHFTNAGQALSYGDCIVLGDLDGDGDLDAWCGTNSGDTVWLNDGSGAFTDSGQSLGGGQTRGVALADLDGDGDLDAFVANQGADKVWLNDGSGSFSDSGQTLGSGSGYRVALGDVDVDGDLDALVVYRISDESTLWLNDGLGVFVDSGQSLPDGCYDVALGDLDGDGDLDAFLLVISGPEGDVWLNNGSGTFSDSGQTTGAHSNGGGGLADIDGDGDLDILIPGTFGADTLWINDGSATFAQSDGSLQSYGDRALAAGDLDGDGDLDACVTGGVESIVWFNNRSPTATDDDGPGFSTDEDTPLDVPDVLANDAEPEGDHFVYVGSDTGGTTGLVTDNGDGTFAYDPNGQFEHMAVGESATDTFTYAIADSFGTEGTGTVTITVWGVNDAPDAVDDTGLTASEDAVFTSATGALLANDTDPDVADLRVVVAYDMTSALGASVTVGADGTFTYDPTSSAALQALASGDSTPDTFAYTISDAHGATDSATVTINVTGANDAPSAVDDDYPSDFLTDEDTALVVSAISVLDNDADLDGGTLVVSDSAATSTFGATVTVNPDGTFTYDPTTAALLQILGTGDTITDTFTYTVADGQGGTGAGMVYVTVDGVDSADDIGQTIIYQTIQEGCGAPATRPGASGSAAFVLLAVFGLGIVVRRRTLER